MYLIGPSRLETTTARAWYSRPVVGPARITDMDGVLPSIYDSPVLTTQPSLPSGNVDCINNIQLINFFGSQVSRLQIKRCRKVLWKIILINFIVGTY